MPQLGASVAFANILKTLWCRERDMNGHDSGHLFSVIGFNHMAKTWAVIRMRGMARKAVVILQMK